MKSVIVGIVLLAGCATLPPPPQERPDTPVTASFGRTWDSVVDYFARSSIPIKTIDRASGLIAAETTRLGGDTRSYGVCQNALRTFSPQGGNFNVLVRGDSARSTLRVTATWIVTPPTVAECQTSDVWEKRFETAIKGRAEAQ